MEACVRIIDRVRKNEWLKRWWWEEVGMDEHVVLLCVNTCTCVFLLCVHNVCVYLGVFLGCPVRTTCWCTSCACVVFSHSSDSKLQVNVITASQYHDATVTV